MPANTPRGLGADALTPGGTLGIIAGSGSLPGLLLNACDSQNIKSFVIAFIGQTEAQVFAGRPHMLTRPGLAGKVVAELRRQGVTDLVWIGGLRRPTLGELRPDWYAARFYTKLGLRALGDDGLLRAVRAELEREGFRFHGIQDFVAGLTGPKGNLGALGPGSDDAADIERGVEAARALGRLDIGQSVVVHQGVILGVEGVEGTDELIHRCGAYRRPKDGGILVKTCKPMQDRNSDMPTIGPKTIECASAAGLHGIVYQAGFTLLPNAQEIAERADRHKIFVTGVELSDE